MFFDSFGIAKCCYPSESPMFWLLSCSELEVEDKGQISSIGFLVNGALVVVDLLTLFTATLDRIFIPRIDRIDMGHR